MQLLAKALKACTDRRLDRIGVRIHALADRLRASLETGLQVGLIHLAKRFVQLGGGRALAGCESTRGVLHCLFQAGEVICQKLALIGELRLLVASGFEPTLVEGASSPLVSKHLTHASRLVLLHARQAIALACQ